MIDEKVLTAVQELTLNLPLATAESAAEALISAPPDAPATVIRGRLQKVFHNQMRYHQVDNLATCMVASGVPPSTVAYAILAAVKMNEYHRKRQSLDLLWTGPETSLIPVRRNDQALLDVIDAAQETLYLVSFAIYQIEGIQTAISRALDRGVQVHLFMEFPQRDGEIGQLKYNTVQAFGVDLALRCWLYEWRIEKRPFRLIWDTQQNAHRKRYATLHAKLAVADDTHLFISSANLTEYAMQHNIEMGVLITEGEEPRKVRQHLRVLVDRGEFELKTKAEIRAFATV